ncbi:hypothetical protein J6590_054335 [Homalodisca vitripennis]|nr:hypothetical protein J6590_054335 [Homalodisca vitripennis]
MILQWNGKILLGSPKASRNLGYRQWLRIPIDPIPARETHILRSTGWELGVHHSVALPRSRGFRSSNAPLRQKTALFTRANISQPQFANILVQAARKSRAAELPAAASERPRPARVVCAASGGVLLLTRNVFYLETGRLAGI